MLRFTAFLPFLILCGCLQTENSSAQDAGYGSSGGSPEFQAARTVLSQYCTGCHVYHTMTEDELIADGVVVAGNAEGSLLYYRIQGSSGASGPKNMPQNGSIATDDVATLKTWIDGI